MLIKQLINLELAIISAHVPCQHMWVRVGPGLSSSSPKQWKSESLGLRLRDGCVKIYNCVSARWGPSQSCHFCNMICLIMFIQKII